jgi:hypothetical protein
MYKRISLLIITQSIRILSGHMMHGLVKKDQRSKAVKMTMNRKCIEIADESGTWYNHFCHVCVIQKFVICIVSCLFL